MSSRSSRVTSLLIFVLLEMSRKENGNEKLEVWDVVDLWSMSADRVADVWHGIADSEP